MRDMFFCEVVLSSPADSGGCIAMTRLSESCEVAFYRVGVDASWRPLDTGLIHDISCIVHCRNRFLAINYLGQVSICNVTGAAPTARPVQSLDLPKQVSPISYLQVNGELHQLGTSRARWEWDTPTAACSTSAMSLPEHRCGPG
jgi:hypothetical protein